MRGRRLAGAMFVMFLAIVVPATAPGAPASGATRAAVPRCRWGNLDLGLGEPTGGGLSSASPRGYTVLVVNVGPTTCGVGGFPTQVELSNPLGRPFHVSVRRRATTLFAEPRATTVILGPGRVASFGFSYSYRRPVPSSVSSSCLASELDVRLPAPGSALYSDFWSVSIDVCATSGVLEVTPLERGAVPAP